MVWRLPICVGALLSEVDRNVDVAGGITEVCGECVEFFLHSHEFHIEAFLFGGEHVERGGIVLVRLEKLSLPPLNLELLGVQCLGLNRGVVLQKA